MCSDQSGIHAAAAGDATGLAGSSIYSTPWAAGVAGGAEVKVSTFNRLRGIQSCTDIPPVRGRKNGIKSKKCEAKVTHD